MICARQGMFSLSGTLGIFFPLGYFTPVHFITSGVLSDNVRWVFTS